jgi:hypothetical protein
VSRDPTEAALAKAATKAAAVKLAEEADRHQAAAAEGGGHKHKGHKKHKKDKQHKKEKKDKGDRKSKDGDKKEKKKKKKHDQAAA